MDIWFEDINHRFGNVWKKKRESHWHLNHARPANRKELKSESTGMTNFTKSPKASDNNEPFFISKIKITVLLEPVFGRCNRTLFSFFLVCPLMIAIKMYKWWLPMVKPFFVFLFPILARSWRGEQKLRGNAIFFFYCLKGMHHSVADRRNKYQKKRVREVDRAWPVIFRIIHSFLFF